MVISPFEKSSGMSAPLGSAALVLLVELVLNIIDKISAGAPGATSNETSPKPKVTPDPITVAVKFAGTSLALKLWPGPLVLVTGPKAEFPAKT
jgi:hypothetical protein